MPLLQKVPWSSGSPSKMYLFLAFSSLALTSQLVCLASSWVVLCQPRCPSGFQRLHGRFAALSDCSQFRLRWVPWVASAGTAADVTRPAGGFHTWAAQSQASLLTTQPIRRCCSLSYPTPSSSSSTPLLLFLGWVLGLVRTCWKRPVIGGDDEETGGGCGVCRKLGLG